HRYVRDSTRTGCGVASLFCFFFQAEDGIRDWSVTGVQTWLFRSPDGTPIAIAGSFAFDLASARTASTVCLGQCAASVRSRLAGRSEERRVGKEGRSRWSPEHEKKRR